MIANARQIIEAASLPDVIGARVALRQQAGKLVGPCPWHRSSSGKNSSFQVSDRGWYCFGCSTGGNVIKFLQDYYGVDFVGAVELLADEVGIPCQYSQAGVRPSGEPTRADLFAACETAAAWYSENLKTSKRAREYMAARGFSDDLAFRWRFGYASGDSILKAGIPEAAAIAAGILKKREPSGDLYDPLAGRFIIPWRNPSGRVVAFVGRDLSGSSPAKYLNTADTGIFQKGELLFGLHKARVLSREAGKGWPVHVLEGQFKAIACQQSGIPAVAPGGTGFSQRQALELSRTWSAAVVVPDADDAGAVAGRRIAAALRSAGIAVAIGRLIVSPAAGDLRKQKKVDPDDLLPLGLPVNFDDRDLVAWLVESNPHPAGSEAWARFFSAEVLTVICAHADPVVVDADLARLAEVSGIDLAALRKSAANAAPVPLARPPASLPDDLPPPDTRMTPGRWLCAAALQYPLGADDTEWASRVAWLHLDRAVIAMLQAIAVVRERARRIGCAVADAVIPSDPAAHQLRYWAAVPLPGVLSPDVIARLSAKLADEHLLKLTQIGDL